MEAKEEFIVTQKWLEEMKAYKKGLQAFKQHFPNGGEALEVLKRCGELCYFGFGEWLVDHLPPIYPPLELNTFAGTLFYPNDVHIKGDLSTQGCIYIKGSLKVDGKLTGNKLHSTLAAFVNADEIDISGGADIQARINANSIIMSDHAFIIRDTVANSISLRDSAQILGNAEAKVINLNGGNIYGDVDADIVNLNSGCIWGSVDANEIYNDGGFIWKNVNTNKIENINNGKVGGKITYKNSDKHRASS